jgi:hypothetical protein
MAETKEKAIDKLAKTKDPGPTAIEEINKLTHSLTEMQKALAGRAEIVRPYDEEDDKPHSELRDRDPRSHITKTMTLGKTGVLEQVSDIGSAEEMRYLVNQDVDGQIMSPLFHIPQYALLSHKVSKDRKSREEYRDILQGSYYQDNMGGIFNSGPQILRKAIRGQQGPPDESTDD